MSPGNNPKVPKEQIVYGDIVYWVTIFAAIVCMVGPPIAMLNTENNVVNPHFLFQGIFDGKSPQQVWEAAGAGFPGGHWYLKNITLGDGLTQLGLALGCSVALWALVATSLVYLKHRKYVFVGLSLWVAMLVLLSATGLVKGGH